MAGRWPIPVAKTVQESLWLIPITSPNTTVQNVIKWSNSNKRKSKKFKGMTIIKTVFKKKKITINRSLVNLESLPNLKSRSLQIKCRQNNGMWNTNRQHRLRKWNKRLTMSLKNSVRNSYKDGLCFRNAVWVMTFLTFRLQCSFDEV